MACTHLYLPSHLPSATASPNSSVRTYIYTILTCLAYSQHTNRIHGLSSLTTTYSIIIIHVCVQIMFVSPTHATLEGGKSLARIVVIIIIIVYCITYSSSSFSFSFSLFPFYTDMTSKHSVTPSYASPSSPLRHATSSHSYPQPHIPCYFKDKCHHLV